MRLLRRLKDFETFDELVAGFAAHCSNKLISSEHGKRYFRAVAGQLDEQSFMVCERDEVLALIECDVANGQLSRFGYPVELRIADGLPLAVRSTIVRDVLGEIGRIAGERQLQIVLLVTTDLLDPDGILASRMFGKEAPRLQLLAEADLALDAAGLQQDMRKGHRQQVKWGLDNIALSVIDRQNPDAAAFDAFRAFHAHVAGRVTRPIESWTAMFEAIAAGHGSLVMGRLDDRLVAGSLVLDAGDTAHYASGVYDRELFDKPLGHANLFRSMLEARQRGLRYFEIGEMPSAGAGVSDKEVSIGRFKQGFTSRTRTRVVWTMQADAPRSP